MRREVEMLKRYTLRQQYLNALLVAASEITRCSGIVVMLFYGANRVMHGHATVGDFVMFLGYQTMLLGSARLLQQPVYATERLRGGGRPHLRILRYRPFRHGCAGRQTPAAPPSACRDLRARLLFLSQRQPGGHPRRHQPAGRPGLRVVLVGESGAGKSTLMNILPRFYDIQQGSILIDGQDIRQATLHSLRRAIGIVPQEPVLFSGTIWENILYGRRDAPREQVIAAAAAGQRARLHQ